MKRARKREGKRLQRVGGLGGQSAPSLRGSASVSMVMTVGVRSKIRGGCKGVCGDDGQHRVQGDLQRVCSAMVSIGLEDEFSQRHDGKSGRTAGVEDLPVKRQRRRVNGPPAQAATALRN